jgi:undecaprenyl-diphosphatase
VVVAGCLLWFVAIAEHVADGGGLVSHDEAVLAWFIDGRSDWSIAAARLVSAAGSFVALLIVGAALGAWLWRRGTRWMLAAAPVSALVVGSLLSTVAKSWYGRDRPPVAVHATTVSLDAFPSGHATHAAAFFGAAALVLALTSARGAAGAIAALLAGAAGALAVGVSRLVLGVHWLSDVVAGWLVGTAVAVSLVMLSWWATTRGVRASARGSDRAPPP